MADDQRHDGPETGLRASESDRTALPAGIGYAEPAQADSGGDCMVVLPPIMGDHACRCTRGTVEHWEHRCYCGAKFWPRSETIPPAWDRP